MITKELIKDVTLTILKRAETTLPEDVHVALRRAYEREEGEIARAQLEAMLENIELAEELQRPICQDTGLPLFFVRLGSGCNVKLSDLEVSIRAGVKKATEVIPLRSNVVDPLLRTGSGENIGDKMPYINYSVDAELDGLEMTVFPKGGGSENMAAFTMLMPKQGAEAVKAIRNFVLKMVVKAAGRPCPPTIIGVGAGGSADVAMKLAKIALLRPVGERHKDERLAEVEAEILEAVNNTGIGPMGLGGKTTALDVHIETASTHITSLPVAVNFQCWAARQATARISSDGTVNYR